MTQKVNCILVKKYILKHDRTLLKSNEKKNDAEIISDVVKYLHRKIIHCTEDNERDLEQNFQ